MYPTFIEIFSLKIYQFKKIMKNLSKFCVQPMLTSVKTGVKYSWHIFLDLCYI